MRHAQMFAVATAALALIGAGQASAKQCRDASGHFITCPAEKTAAASSPTRCRDAKGAYTKCSASISPTGGMAAATTTTTTTMSTNTGKSSKAGKAKTTGASAAASAPAAASNTAATAPMPAGAVTAKCKDGSVSHSQHRSGTCASHGGVASWM